MTTTDSGVTQVQGSEEFAERMLEVLNGGALALALSIGHRVGLLDALSALPPATSAQVADAAGLDERYVREWLSALAVGGVVDHDPDALTFTLPAERAAWLTRAAGPANLALQAQYVALLAQVEDRVVECFRRGGGVPYSAYPRFTALMAEDSAAVHDSALLDQILPLVPGLPDRLRAGIDVLDIGCGAGHALALMAEAFPASRFLGVDLGESAIEAARGEAARKGLENVRFELQDAARLDVDDAFDLVTTFDAVHDQARPDLVLAAICRALRPDGVYLCVDIRGSSVLAENLDHPLGPFLYMLSCMHCMTVSLADGGMGLGTMWGEQRARSMLAEAGLTSVEVHHLDDDILNTYYVARKATA